VTTASGLLTAPGPDVAKRTWPGYLVGGVLLIVVGVVSALWPAGGARLVLTTLGFFLAVRGAALLRGSRSGALDGDMGVRARRLGGVAFVVGVLTAGVSQLPVAGLVLLVGLPVLLLVTALALLARGGTARRGGLALLVWTLLVTAVLVAAGLGQDWDRAADVARVAAAFAVAVVGVPMLLAAASLRAVASSPPPAPARSAGCAGCACSAGGCGAG
jgi:hypothetical protein